MASLAGFLLAATLAGLAVPAAAASGGDRGTCEWRAPAHDPFTGDIPSAVDDYPDIPAATRARLKARMRDLAYDDLVAIRRDSIEGNARYAPELRGMHFGNRRLCGEVTRKTWRPDHEERGLAYCEDGHCVVVPLVCHNVSRIVRQPGTVAMRGGGGPHEGPLTFEPPAAGLPATPGTEGAGPTVHTLDAEPPAVARLTPLTETPVVAAPLPPLPPAVVPPPVSTPSVPSMPIGQPALPPVVIAPPGIPPLPPAPPIPEPATVLLWGAGLAVGAVWQWRRRRAGTPPA